MLLKDLLESQQDSITSSAIDLVNKVDSPSALSKVAAYLNNLLVKIDIKRNIPDEPEEIGLGDQNQVKENIESDKEFIIASIQEIADSGNEEQLNAVISFLKGAELLELSKSAIESTISQGVKGGLDQKLAQIIQNYNIRFDQKEKSLQNLISNKGLWDGNILIKNKTGNIYSIIADPLFKGIAKNISLQFRGTMGYGPDQGPGEFLLALTGKGIDLAEKSDLVLVNGIGVEVKADNGGIRSAAGKVSRSGGRLYSTSGYGTAGTARVAMYKSMIENGVPESVLSSYGWPTKKKGQKIPPGGLNFNKSGINNLNKIFSEYLDQEKVRSVLKAMISGLYLDLPENMENDFINIINPDGTIDFLDAQIKLVALAHEYYKHQEGHDYIMVFNTKNGDYVMIKDGEDIEKLVKSGDLKFTAYFDFFDDRSKGSPQLLTK